MNCNRNHSKYFNNRSIRATGIILVSLLLSQGITNSIAQELPPNVPLHRLDYRDLGYRFFNEIPGDGAFITSLATGKDGRIYGATSGVQANLFAFSMKTDQVKPLGTVADARGVHNSLVVDNEGFVYLGTGKNVLERLTISHLTTGRNHISADMWTLIEEHYNEYEGGRIYRYDPSNEPAVVMPDHVAELEDLGIPVPGESIYSMTIDRDRQYLYGITYPRGHFFQYDLADGRVTDKGPVFKNILFADPDDRMLRMLPRDLIVADKGHVYMSTDNGNLMRFDPESQELETLDARIPGEIMQVVDSWTRDGAILYGGTSEGFLFRYIPSSGEIENLGKPIISQRIRGLTTGPDRMLYGIAGDRSVTNMFFRYDLRRRQFENLGTVSVNRSPYYMWRAQQFDAMVTGQDGTIFMGESDRRGRLFFYIP